MRACVYAKTVLVRKYKYAFMQLFMVVPVQVATESYIKEMDRPPECTYGNQYLFID